MLEKFIDIIVNKLFLQLNKTSDFLIHSIIIVVIVAPVILAGGYSVWREYKDMTDLAYARKEIIVGLMSQVMKERLDHIFNVNRSIAIRRLVWSNLKENNTKELAAVLDNLPKEFPFIDRIFITDLSGISVVIVPASPENIGKNFSYRDWYKGVTKDWKPYLSEVYKRTSTPQYNVMTSAIPINDDSGNVIGILGMQIKLDIFTEWAEEVSRKFDCVIHFVDKNGKVIGSTQYLPQEDIIDLSAMPAVQNVLKGKEGAEIYFNDQTNEDFLVSYKNIPEYNVGVVVERSAKKSFALRREHLIETSIFYGVILIINSLLAYLIFKILHTLNYYRKKEKTFLDSIGDGVTAIDRNWNIVLWNKAMASLSGYSEKEAIGKPFRDIVKLVRKNDRKEDIVFVEEAMLYGNPMQMGENMILITKDQKEIPVGDTAAPIFDGQGVLGVIIVIRNATKEKEAQMIKSDFAYASHQLRTPVNKALWSMEAVMREKIAKNIRDKVSAAYKSLQSTQKLANELIEVSTIDQSTIFPQKALVRIVDVFEKTRKTLESKLKEKEADLAMPLISVSASIETDEKLLSRALYEIIENAILYGPEKGKINIEVKIDPENMIIAISDNGIGIPEDQQTLIFAKFFRGHNIDTTNIIGGGLGLYIAQKYIDLIGGKIWFESEEGKGTKFFISLPIK